MVSSGIQRLARPHQYRPERQTLDAWRQTTHAAGEKRPACFSRAGHHRCSPCLFIAARGHWDCDLHPALASPLPDHRWLVQTSRQRQGRLRYLVPPGAGPQPARYHQPVSQASPRRRGHLRYLAHSGEHRQIALPLCPHASQAKVSTVLQGKDPQAVLVEISSAKVSTVLQIAPLSQVLLQGRVRYQLR